MSNNIHNVVIIGSGPAGYTASLYAARADLAPILYAGWIPGGALINTTEVENYPGFPDGIMGPDLMDNMLEQAKKFGTEIICEDIEEVKKNGDVFELSLSDDTTILAKTVILAMGAQHRHLGVVGEDKFGGRGVSYCATCDAQFFKDKKVLVVGGGDSAVEEATFLAKFASEVVLIHRRDKLRASMAMQKRIDKTDNLSVMWNTVIDEVYGDTAMTGVKITTNVNGQEVKGELEAQGLFVAIGHNPRNEIVKDFVAVDDNGYVKTTGFTTEVLSPEGEVIPGLFACGDLVDSRYRQAITAAGTGCSSALDALKYLESLED